MWRGINRAGMEYGDDWNGWTGQTYFEIPSNTAITAEIAYYKAKGMNIVRLPISWERIQYTLNGPLTTTYVNGMMNYINKFTAAGFQVVLDLHAYARYAQNTHNASGVQQSGYTQRTMGDGFLTFAHLTDVWTKLTNLVKANPRVILGLMNEAHDFPIQSAAWFAGIQNVVNAIRAAGSTQLILIPNTRGSDVTHWSTYAPNGGALDSVAALAITDSNYAFDMHAYQDSPTSATSYASLVTPVTTWAKTNKRRLFLSELGVNKSAANGAVGIAGLINYLNANSDVWLGFTPWNLPPYDLWTGNYTVDGPALNFYKPFLTPGLLK